MSDDPRGELLRKTGPLGEKSDVPAEALERSTDPEAVMIYQNEQILLGIGELRGSIEAVSKGAHGRMDRLENRISPLEIFNSRIMAVPKGLEWVIKLGCGGLALDGLHSVGKFFGWCH